MVISIINALGFAYLGLLALTPFALVAYFTADAVWPERVSCRQRSPLLTDEAWLVKLKNVRQISAFAAVMTIVTVFVMSLPFWA